MDNLTKALLIVMGVVILLPILYILGIIYGVFAYGFVLATLWKWYTIPVFGLPALSKAAAYGICLMAALLTHTYHHTPREEFSSNLIGVIAATIITPWSILLTGWLVKCFFM